MVRRVLLFTAVAVLSLTPAFAVVTTTFNEGSLNPNVLLDVPNNSAAAIALDTANQELDFTTTGSADLWSARGDAPFAWTSRPAVNLGDTWYVETEMHFDNDVLSARDRVAGITFYGGPDGSGGSNDGMDFTFGINNWDDRFDPGYVAGVEVQGLNDNAPGDLGSDLNAPWTSPDIFLRVEITEQGASDLYTFFYKASAAAPWTLLGSLHSTVDNSRATLFLKTGGAAGAADRAASFTYFNVGVVAPAEVPSVPALDGRSLGLLAALLAVAGFVVARR